MADAQGSPLSCFLLGYGGANNTGADARLLTAVRDVRAAFGPSARVTVGTLDAARTLRILPSAPRTQVVGLPYIFPLAVLALVARHDVTVLVEGSTFKDSWSPSLLHAFLWAAWCAHVSGRRCVAYAVDVGQLRPLNRWLTRKICQRLDLLITRSMAARSRLLDLGVVREIHVTADLAFRFVDGLGVPTASNLRSVVGIVPIEFYQWPIRARLFGRRAHLHRWPYYRTWTAERAAASNRMVALYQRLVAHCIDHHDLDVLLIAMDELDVEVCGKIAEGLAARHAERVRRASSIELSPFEMAALLRSLGYLVTSRYHACVLSMASGVPQMAIAHDERLPAIYDELELNDFLLWYQAPGLAETALEKFDRMVKHADVLRAKLQDKHQKWFVPASQRNREQLACWASAQSR